MPDRFRIAAGRGGGANRCGISTTAAPGACREPCGRRRGYARSRRESVRRCALAWGNRSSAGRGRSSRDWPRDRPQVRDATRRSYKRIPRCRHPDRARLAGNGAERHRETPPRRVARARASRWRGAGDCCPDDIGRRRRSALQVPRRRAFARPEAARRHSPRRRCGRAAWARSKRPSRLAALPEERGAHADDSGAFLDGGLKIVRHAHR